MHIHPYGTFELRQADLAVRFHLLSIASRKIEEVRMPKLLADRPE